MVIGILGATGHIAKNLIMNLPVDMDLMLFARRPESLASFLRNMCAERPTAVVHSMEAFPHQGKGLDAVINCVGLGTPEKVEKAGVEIFRLTERFDWMILDYIASKPTARYINFSSGVVHDQSRSATNDQRDEFSIDLDVLSARDAYRVAKLNSEAKHRALSEFSIIDLRVFGFYSHFIDLSSTYLMAGIARAILEGEEFITDKRDVVRDYVHPRDLAQIVLRCAKAEMTNCAMDVYSLKPVKKSEILKCFQERYGLRVRVLEIPVHVSPTKDKPEYLPRNRSANALLHYTPSFTSLQCLTDETDILLRDGGSALRLE